nr:MAG TPA: hypothetical protein [Caudoviricetes sp.]
MPYIHIIFYIRILHTLYFHILHPHLTSFFI